MNRLAKVCARYLGGHRGFSIGIEDVTPGAEVCMKQAMLQSPRKIHAYATPPSVLISN